jgi:hypothetical protein
MYTHQGTVLEEDAARHLDKCFETLPNTSFSAQRTHVYFHF